MEPRWVWMGSHGASHRTVACIRYEENGYISTEIRLRTVLEALIGTDGAVIAVVGAPWCVGHDCNLIRYAELV